MSAPSPSRLLDIQQMGDVTVVKINPRNLMEEATAKAIGEQLLSLVKEAGCSKLVLDLSKVERITSMALGKVVGVHKEAEAAGGRLTLCKIQPRVKAIFDLLKLPTVLHIYD